MSDDFLVFPKNGNPPPVTVRQLRQILENIPDECQEYEITVGVWYDWDRTDRPGWQWPLVSATPPLGQPGPPGFAEWIVLFAVNSLIPQG